MNTVENWSWSERLWKDGSVRWLYAKVEEGRAGVWRRDPPREREGGGGSG